MGREDPTFTSGDIVRIWCNNLDEEEQKWVVIFFITVVPGIFYSNKQVIEVYELITQFVKNKLLTRLIKFAIKNMRILRRILNVEWANMIFESPLRKEVIKCIMKRTRQ